MAYGPSELMGDLVSLVDKRWVTVQDIQRMGQSMPLHSVAELITFYREIKRLLRLLPIETFDDEEQRHNLLNACQLAMDLAIDQEEDEWQAQ